ncbi:glycosyl hydrolase [Rathayibacter sp. SD072]|uniref:glycosyl hydrolase n=1 Tax=Rathayibacter sp. SD072 TaxID=2781731 RepID=UPI001A977212|nr:glycosyl hydrolase [Rathayibacter sp. SD072]MBO0984720.1 hypothetical protein [Rathayibacter sp. SD072]
MHPAPDWAVEASAHAGRLPQVAGPYAGAPRLADGVPPPTNSWASGPVFADGLPLYTGILSVTPRSDGFSVGLPQVDATPRALFGLARDDLTVTVPSSSVELTALDDLVSTWSYAGAGELVTAEGWPYASYLSREPQDVIVEGATEPERAADGLLLVSAGGQRYALVAPASALDAFPRMRLEGRLVVFAVPEGASRVQVDAMRRGAVALEGATVAHSTAGGRTTTTYTLRTEGGASTFFGLGSQGDPGYDTLYGRVGLESGTTFSRSTAAIAESGALDLTRLTDDERGALRRQVPLDAADVRFAAPDTYGAGKELYRAATLHRLATDLGLDETAAVLHEQLLAELDLWLDPTGCTVGAVKCFVYDPVLGGMVGSAPSFGSEEFNDHHFHYGYFLSALGMLAEEDPSLVERYRTVADLLALDLASPVDTAEFPRLRVFDAYRGHSWASGLAPARDGNNQESVSEAVNAWNGLALWASASGNEALLEQARWMLSLETEAAADLWLSPTTPPGFDAPFLAINWGGKRDYATFFDATPSAILGIELLPLPPATAFLPGPDRVDELVAGAPGSPLADYVVMLQATSDPEAALSRAAQLTDAEIDSANSRSYLLAWILTR